MSEQRTRMKIAIDGKVYLLDTGIRKSLTQIPWESRKKVIEVLEAVKHAEHIETAKPPQKTAIEPEKTVNQKTVMVNSAGEKHPSKSNAVDVDSKDPDAIMQQLLMQQPSQQGVPDRMAAIKWIVVFFVVIIALAFIF